MKRLLIPVMVLSAAILAAFLLFSDPNVIDQDYISSSEYEDLEHELEKNKSQNKTEETALKQLILELALNSSGYSRKLPIRLDSISVDSILSRNGKIDIGDKYTGQSSFTNNNYYSVLILEEGEIHRVLFLVESKGLYKDIDLLLATTSDSAIVDLESIGSFEKNISEEVYSIIHIESNSLIRTTVIKNRFYPVNQQNKTNYRYEIGPDGHINSRVLSGS